MSLWNWMVSFMSYGSWDHKIMFNSVTPGDDNFWLFVGLSNVFVSLKYHHIT